MLSQTRGNTTRHLIFVTHQIPEGRGLLTGCLSTYRNPQTGRVGGVAYLKKAGNDGGEAHRGHREDRTQLKPEQDTTEP